jgi:hypothetical protein
MGVFYSIKFQVQWGVAALLLAAFLTALSFGGFFSNESNFILLGMAVPLLLLGSSNLLRAITVWYKKEPMTFEPSRIKYVKEPLRPAYVYFGDIAYKCTTCGRELKSNYVSCPYCGTPTR